MTLPAVASSNVRPVAGPAYKVGPNCSNPHCSKFVDDVHHIVRRGKLVKDYDWVAIDGFVIGNRTGLCAACHRDVTGQKGHVAWIRWVDGVFWWCLVGPPDELGKPTPLPVAPIEPQPPTPDTLATRAADSTETGPDACPFCGQATRRRSTSPSGVGRRWRKSWTVKVPADELEQGADVLDSLIIALAPLVPNADDSTTGRYYVLVPALAFALMSSQEFVASFEGRNAA